MKHKIFFIICFLFPIISYSQNYIKNGSFEEVKWKLFYFSRLEDYNNWFTPNGGTADAFIEEQGKPRSIPDNFMGEQESFDGQYYAGFFTYDKSLLREYISTELTASLTIDILYCVKFYVSLADASYYATNIDIAFSEKKINQKQYSFISIDKRNSVYSNYTIKERINWVELSYIYKSNGNEKFLIIGNFMPDSLMLLSETRPLKVFRRITKNKCAYYYIDNVSLIEISDSSECPCYHQQEIVVKDSIINEIATENHQEFILENIYFETDKSILLDSSYKELDAMFEILSTNNSNKIIIAGHTDNQGDEKHNQLLSEARAKAVYSYFIEKGIAASRMEYIGYGSTKPISDNNTEEGRRKNRRVEILIE